MIKGVLIILFLSGESQAFNSEVTYSDLASCREAAVKAIISIKDNPDIAGIGFTCEPAGTPS